MRKRPFYFDGAFGTYYSEKYHSDEPCELANLRYPKRVLQIHREYIDAGVNAIKTNTFQVNHSLTKDEATLRELLTAGYQLAMEAVNGTDVAVFCDIGYIDGEHKREEYLRNIDVFLSLGATRFIFETLQEYKPLNELIPYIRKKAPAATVLVSFSVSQDGYTKKGYYYETLLKQARQDADIVGLNCQCGPSHLYRLLRQLPLGEYPGFSAMPNAGYPQAVNGRMVYTNNKEYYAQRLASIASLGVLVLGGCCGTTPEHLQLAISMETPESQVLGQLQKGTKAACRSSVLRKLKNAQKVIAVEIDPPADTNVEFLLNASRQAAASGADVITIADSPLARSRADSMILAAKVKREIGVETLPHLSCRDKNDIAIKSLLMGANIEEINHVLVVTGDPLSGGKGSVFQFNSFELMNMIGNLNEDVFLNNPYTVCGALNINALHFEAELKRARRKAEAGARILFTQPIFSEEAAKRFLKAKEELNCYLFAGILPIAGWKNALFLNNEVSGITIPDDLIEKLRYLPEEEGRELVISYSMKFIKMVYQAADGFYLMTPLKKIDLVVRLIDEIKQLEKEDAIND